jgi:hypothetical protein
VKVVIRYQDEKITVTTKSDLFAGKFSAIRVVKCSFFHTRKHLYNVAEFKVYSLMVSVRIISIYYQLFHVLPTQCVYVFFMDLRM